MLSPASSFPSEQKADAESRDSRRFVESVNPATGEVKARIAATPVTEIPEMLSRARHTQSFWAAQPLAGRCEVLRRFRDVVFARKAEITATITREAGKPRAEALFAEIFFALDTADFLARKAPRWLRSQRVPHHSIALKTKRGRLYFEPMGVVALITPWNYPFAIPVGQILPAIAAGNAVLCKCSDLTPATGALMSELFREAGAPAGLVQFMQGCAEVGAALIEAGPDKVFFTGSVETGRKVAEACARKLIPSVLELGGKDAMIVLADAHLENAASAAVWGGCTNAGQACLSVERIYIEEKIAAEFIALCREKIARLRIGNASSEEVEVGAMIRARQAERVREQLRDAEARGAEITCFEHGGNSADGIFLAPAMVTNVNHSMQLMREETFGPVIAIQSVRDAEEAIRLANDSEFALAASVWTGDVKRGREIAARLRTGAVMINDMASYYGCAEAPHGGRGASGWGRVHSRLGLLEMVHVKYVDEERLAGMAKPWWFSYGGGLADAADRFIEILFAPNWKVRARALFSDSRPLKPLWRKDAAE